MMTPNDSQLDSQISALFSHHRRSFLLYQTGTDAEIHSQTLCRVRDLGTLSPKGDGSMNPSSQGSGNLEEEAERI